MRDFFSKITRLNLPIFQSNGKAFFNDFMQFDQSLNADSALFKTEETLNKHLENFFKQFAKRKYLKIKIYYKGKSSKDWFDVIHKKPAQFKNVGYIEEHFSEIFNEEVKIHNYKTFGIKNEKNSDLSFLSLHVNNKYFYVIEIKNFNYARRYYYLLFSLLIKLLDACSQIREKQRLKDYVTSLEKNIEEKEISLRLADKAIKRKVYDLHNLVEASNEIYSILNFKQLINSALLTIIGQLGIQSAFVLMYDAKEHSYCQNYQKGFRDEEILNLAFVSDSPIAKYFAKHTAPVYYSNLEKNKKLATFTKKLKSLGISLIAPIIYSERLQGIIAAGEKLYTKNYTQTDFEIFHILVNIISISIGNAQHYEEMRNLSLTDAMTNLHNYRYFIERLKEELNRSKRNDSKVSLLMLDIDHFKNYNDTLGHQSGDEALRNVGKVLKSTVRDEDIVTRYGGEEFCIILPGIPKEGIRPLAERVRKKIEKFNFYKEEVQPFGILTVSLGGATYPDDADHTDELIQKADEALYRAKETGRNRLRIYSKTGNKQSEKK